MCSECTLANATVSHSSNDTCNFTTYSLPPIIGRGRDIELIPNATSTFCDGSNETVWKVVVVTPNADVSIPNSEFTNTTDLYLYGTWEGVHPIMLPAYKCSFYFCVKGYSATASHGTTVQLAIPIIASQAHPVFRNYSGTSGFWWKFEDLPKGLNAEPASEWMVRDFIELNLAEALTGALSGESVYFSKNNSRSGTKFPTIEILANASESLANLTALIQRISDGLTSYIRTDGQALPPDPRYAPTVSTSVPVTVVRWGWLGYAIAVQAGGLTFLGLTICLTRRRQVLPWKGHRMPLLLANLDESLQARAQGGLAYRQGLDDRVGDLQVCLDFDGDNGLAFRRA